MLDVKIKRDVASADVPLPEYKTPGAAGADVRSAEDVTLKPGEARAVSTGLYLEIPDGFECQVRPRSGLALTHGVTVANAPGTIDADYRGELKVIMIVLGDEPFEIKRGDRIAQLVFARVERAAFIEADELSDTERSAGGFGHSGIR